MTFENHVTKFTQNLYNERVDKIITLAKREAIRLKTDKNNIERVKRINEIVQENSVIINEGMISFFYPLHIVCRKY